MRHLTLLSLTLLTSGGLYALAQAPAAKAPAAKETAPAAAKEAAPAAEPSRASVEKYVTELKAVITLRETSAARLINEITALDKSIQQAVEKILQILTTAKDSKETRSKVSQMKEETIAALKRAAETYAQKRALIAEELRTTKNEYRREDLFNSRGQIDARIDKMVDGIMKLALSMETDEGHERYVQDSSVMVGGGRYGIAVPTTKRNPEYDQNKRQAGKTNKVSTELDKALEASLQRLDTQERDLVAKLAKAATGEEKTRLTGEIERIRSIREERVQQQAMLEAGPQPGGESELGKNEAMETEELVESIMAGGRRDFVRMMAAFGEVRTERQALAALKAKLDHATKWLETHPAAK